MRNAELCLMRNAELCLMRNAELCLMRNAECGIILLRHPEALSEGNAALGCPAKLQILWGVAAK